MGYVLMVMYFGTSIYMHDFADVEACNNAMNTVIRANQGSPTTVRAYCLPKAMIYSSDQKTK